MPSTWMDPLIQAQHTKRRTHAVTGAAIWAAKSQAEPRAKTQIQEDDIVVPQRSDRHHLKWDSLDMDAAVGWDVEPGDILPEIEREICLLYTSPSPRD